MKHIYNLKKDKKDPRDYKPSKFHLVPRWNLPPSVNLAQKFNIPSYNQADIGSCTSNAGSFAVEYDENMQKEPDWMPSRLFLYYCERDIDGDTDQDGGSSLRQCVSSIHTTGVCPESMWEYNNNNLYTKPTDTCYTEALKCVGLTYYSLNNVLLDLQGCLAAGYPFIFGTELYESFESSAVANTGVVPMPSANEQLLGGHALAAVGYDIPSGMFIIRNSWGTDWGLKSSPALAGHCLMPFEYFAKYVSDIWTIRRTS